MGRSTKIRTHWRGFIYLLAIESNPLGKINILLNGQSTTVTQGSIAELIEQKNLNPELIIVEYNNTILNKKDYSSTLIKPNDTIEIIRYIGGGNK